MLVGMERVFLKVEVQIRVLLWLWRFSLIFGKRSATGEILSSSAAAGSPQIAEFNMRYSEYLHVYPSLPTWSWRAVGRGQQHSEEYLL